jgi:hypothetical protein
MKKTSGSPARARVREGEVDYDCSCDGETPEWSRQSRVKRTRQVCTCSECGAVLPAGSSVTRTDMKFEGTISKHIICIACEAFFDYAVSHIPCLCWSYGRMFDDVLEAAYEWAVAEPESGAPALCQELREKRAAIKAAAKASREQPREGEGG